MLVFSLNFYSFQRLNNALLRFLHVNRVNVSPIYLFACIVIEVFFIKFEEKGRSRISAYLAKIKHNLQKISLIIGIILEIYYATFSSTISKPKGKGNSKGRLGGKAVQKRGNFRGGRGGFSRCFSGGSG